MVLQIFFLTLQLLFALFFFFLCLAFLTGAPFVPSTNTVAKKMIELAHIKKGERIIDLGSGDGRLLFFAAQKGAHARGIEINPFLAIVANIKAFFSPYRTHVHTDTNNFWKTDIHDANILFIYLLPWRMEILEKKLLHECHSGTRIVSNSFIFPHIPCTQKDETLHVYVFTVPKKIV